MKKATHGPTPIPIPSPVDHFLSIGRFSRQVVKSLTALRDRSTYIPQVMGISIPSLPFAISASSSKITAAAGTFCEDALPETVETSPANGLWYFQGILTINSTTGAKTSATVEWTQTEGADSSTTFYTTIGSVFIGDGGVPGVPTNFNYGPIVGLIHGGIENVWDVTFF